MKKKQKLTKKEATVVMTTTDSSLAPTLFDQMVVINSALRKEMGLVPNEMLPQPKFEMPPWCQNIARQLRKTVFKPLLKLRPTGTVDWRNYGRMITIAERYKTYLIHDVPRILEAELGDLTDDDWKRVEPRLGLDKIRGLLIKMLDRPVAEDEPLEKIFDEVLDRQWENLEKQKQAAFRHVADQCPKNTALFFKGMGEGYELFMDERAAFCGDRGRANIYLTLLGSMMEVEKIRRTLPPMTRPQFYDDLARVFKMRPGNYDWFNDVCDDIKFPLNYLGRKPRAPAASV